MPPPDRLGTATGVRVLTEEGRCAPHASAERVAAIVSLVALARAAPALVPSRGVGGPGSMVIAGGVSPVPLALAVARAGRRPMSRLFVEPR
jgi:hypothetical protein